MTKIDKFQGEYRWLSNFWPVEVAFDGHTYPSVEHAYAAAKTFDEDFRRKVRMTKNPGDVKRLGRTIPLREDWDEVRIGVMVLLTSEKYKNKKLRKLLLETGDCVLEEGNTWGDTFWGVCRGKGENNLGKILMSERDKIREEEENE